MSKVGWLLLVLVGANLAGAEEPPYKRLLQGDDAKKAKALSKRIEELWATGKFGEAVAAAEEELALRRRVQGEAHWEAADAVRRADTLRQAARLPPTQQKTLAEVPRTEAKARELDAQGKYAQAEPLYRKVLAVREELLGPKHPETATSYDNLAVNLYMQGRAHEAEPLYRNALAVRQEVLGTKHPQTAGTYNNFGANLDALGRAREAETLYRKALAVQEEVLGPRHPDTAESYNSLGVNLLNKGRTQEAEPLLRQALAVWEEVHGPKHPQTAHAYNNLAYNLDLQGRTQEAEPLYRKALAIRQAALGLEHPDTAYSYNNLGGHLQARGHVREAEPLFREALAIREKVLGPRHPDTAGSYHMLGGNLQAQGRAREAELLFRKALAVREEVLGPKHPSTASSYNELAYNLDTQGRAREAELLYRKAVAVDEEVLGPKHPNTITSYNNLATNFQAQDRAQEAEPLLRKALAVREEVLGLKHPDTATSYHNLAYSLQTQGRTREAEPLFRKALAVYEEVLGPKHPRTLGSCHNLATNLQIQGRAQEAEPLFHKTLAVREEVLGLRHPHTAQSYSDLALNLQVQDRIQEAEPLWKTAADGVELIRLRLAGSSLDRGKAVHIQPHVGLATCRARLGRPVEAWMAAEAGLARGLLDDLAAALLPDAEVERRDHERAARLDALDRMLTPLLTAAKLDDRQQRRRAELLRERSRLDTEAASVAAERSGRAVLPLADVQAALAADAALLFWVDPPKTGDHWGCVVRNSGLPAWMRLKGSGPEGAWTAADDKLPRLLRDDLSHGEPSADRHAGRLAAQRLEPLASHLGASETLPAVRRLVVVPVGVMAGIPIEVLTDRYQVSYAPSGSVFTRLVQKHRALSDPTLLALGDPNFQLPNAAPPPAPPKHGLYLSLVLPGGNAARAGLHSGDVLLTYNGSKLTTKADLKLLPEGAGVPIEVWRDGKTLNDLRLDPGKLGVVISEDAPAEALRKRRELDLLADARVRSGLQPLPGTRLEVAALAALLPKDHVKPLLGSAASEQQLAALAAAGKLKEFRLLHLATHGTIDPVSAAHSALELARDQLPEPEEQARLAAAGKNVPTGRLSVDDIAKHWQLDADLVTLSACQTALGPQGGGEGLLGFSQVLLGRGARSLLLSLWKVDDTATALLMSRFYQNLLGKRDDLKAPLPKTEALREAKRWLRQLPRAEVEKLAGQLAKGEVRATEEPKLKGQAAVPPALPRGETPFAHPYYWAAFILIGDPD
jgi:tetratricopeptide (TPR) repeat protein